MGVADWFRTTIASAAAAAAGAHARATQGRPEAPTLERLPAVEHARALAEEAERFPIESILRGPPQDPSFWLLGNKADEQVIKRPYHEHVFVNRCVGLRATALSTVPVLVDRVTEEGLQPQPDHPLTKLFRKPNPRQSFVELADLTQKWMDTRGESFWLLKRTRPTEYPTEIWGWPGGRDVWSIGEVDANNAPLTWKRTWDGKTTEYPAWQVIPWGYPDPEDPRRGLAPLAAGRIYVDADALAARFNRAFFLNGGVPFGVIKVAGNLKPGDRANIYKDYADRHEGVGKAWRPIITEGNVTYEPTGLSHTDMLFLEQHRWNRDAVASLFGVPLFMLGVTDQLNRATAFAAREEFYSGTILPLLALWELTLNAHLLLTIDEGQYAVRFDTSKVVALQGDLRERWETARLMQERGVPMRQVNDVLRLGLKAWDGWDVPLVPASLIPLELVTSGGTAPANEPGAPADDEPAPAAPDEEPIPDEEYLGSAAVYGTEAEVVAARIAGFVSSLPRAQQRGAKEDRIRQLQWRRIVLDPSEARMMKVVAPWLKGLAADVIERFDRFARSQRGAPAGTIEKVVTEADLSEILFSVEEWREVLVAAYRPTQVAVGQLSAAFAEQELAAAIGPQATVDLMTEPMRQYFESRAAKVAGLPQTYQVDLARELRAGIQAQESIAVLRARLESFVNGKLLQPMRASRIAITETGTLANGVRFQGAKANEVEHHVWVTAGDDQVRASHVEAERESRANPVRVGEPFANGLLFPGDPGADAGEVINCRCMAVFKPRPTRLVLPARHQHGRVAA